MKPKYLIFLICIVLLSACSTKKHTVPFRTDYYITGTIKPLLGEDTITYIDSSRMRRIPVAIYYMRGAPGLPKKIVLLNPGYGGTRDGYRFLVDTLAKSGYMVVVIQHDLPGDAPLPETGDIYKLRKPIWANGVKDIFFVYNKIQEKYAWRWMDYKHPVLIGHSNGGDMAMLIANEHPDFARVVITLDNRRVPFPRAISPKILSVRSSDQPVDPGVLPTEDEQKRFHIKIIKVNIKHNDMGGTGTLAQLDELNGLVLKYLKHND
jgi:predicted dienelactone hydrolase